MYDKSKWSNQIILSVWKKAKVTKENPDVFRKDECGAWIQFSKHGNRNAKYGWEIDHIKPIAHDGSDLLYNLQPLHWENNMAKGDSSELKCAVTN